MADDLKRSVEPPVCDHCRLQMKWYRSVRLEGELVVVEHYFQCIHCDRFSVKKTSENGVEIPMVPQKLSQHVA